MPQDVFVDLCYRGLDLGTGLCMQDFTESAAYLQCPKPMPVGSTVVIRVGDDLEIEVFVQQVNEQVSATDQPVGMLVGAGALEGQAREWWSSQVGAAPAGEPAGKEADTRDTEEMDAVPPEPVAAAQEEESPEVTTEKAAEPVTPEEDGQGKAKKRKRRKRR